MAEARRGLVLINIGPGKGKTTAAITAGNRVLRKDFDVLV
jgi:ATP:corrinoid adenosyltransferase